MQCKAQVQDGPLKVETFPGTSGPGQKVVCKIENGADVRHIVSFYNLQSYPVDLTCNASLKADPSKLQFQPATHADLTTTTRTWRGTITSLGIKQYQDFSHAKLISLQNSPGRESVEVKIEARWPQPGKTRTITLSITVEV